MSLFSEFRDKLKVKTEDKKTRKYTRKKYNVYIPKYKWRRYILYR
jgi:hypothetical protein